MRIRYMVAPTDRQRMWSGITRDVADKLDRNEKVSYALNKSNVFVNYRQGEAYPPQNPEGQDMQDTGSGSLATNMKTGGVDTSRKA